MVKNVAIRPRRSWIFLATLFLPSLWYNIDTQCPKKVPRERNAIRYNDYVIC